jgi:type I restriction enzyme S subunit
MQQLLTGQTRLPGFTDQWKTVTLGSLGQFHKGAGVKKDDAKSGELACIRYGEIYTRHHDVIREFSSRISIEVASGATCLRSGDILFAASGETKAEIGKAVAFIHDCEAYAGGDILILRPSASDATFLGYYLNSSPIQLQKASRGQGDAVVHISASSLAAIALKLPDATEQAAIGRVLVDMDAELSVLEQRHKKTRALKQGMMQELLTGRTRLVSPEIADA